MAPDLRLTPPRRPPLRPTRDDWMMAGGRPRLNAEAHLEDLVRRRASEMLPSDPTGVQLLMLKRRTCCTLQAIADGLALPYHRLYYRLRKAEEPGETP